MEEAGKGLREKKDPVDATLDEAVHMLYAILKRLAASLDPFPPFIGMTSIQAVEVELQDHQASDRGCVVVCPDGELYELHLNVIPGPTGAAEADQVAKRAQIHPISPQRRCSVGRLAEVVDGDRLEFIRGADHHDLASRRDAEQAALHPDR